MSIAAKCTCGHGGPYCTDSVSQCNKRISTSPAPHPVETAINGRWVKGSDRNPPSPNESKKAPETYFVKFWGMKSGAEYFGNGHWVHPNKGTIARSEIEWLEEYDLPPAPVLPVENGIPTAEDNPHGFHRRYTVIKANGQAVDKEAEYMVLRLDWAGDDKVHIRACRTAAIAYANAIQYHIPKMAEDIFERYSNTEQPGNNQIHIALPAGGIARVQSEASPELLGALNKMVELARENVAEEVVPIQQEEIRPEMQRWMMYEMKMIAGSDRMKGAIEVYHKMHPEITQLKKERDEALELLDKARKEAEEYKKIAVLAEQARAKLSDENYSLRAEIDNYKTTSNG